MLAANIRRAFTPSSVRDETLIHHHHSLVGSTDPPSPSPTDIDDTPTSTGMPSDDPVSEDVELHGSSPDSLHQQAALRGDIMCRGFYERGTDLIIDVRVVDADSRSYRTQAVIKILKEQERRKRNLYLRKCLDQRRHFAPYVVSCDGILAKEARSLHKALDHRLAKKWDCSVSRTSQFVNMTMSVAILRASHRCLRGTRTPASTMSKRLPLWEDEAGLGLFFS